jgi:hypothetical protein
MVGNSRVSKETWLVVGDQSCPLTDQHRNIEGSLEIAACDMCSLVVAGRIPRNAFSGWAAYTKMQVGPCEMVRGSLAYIGGDDWGENKKTLGVTKEIGCFCVLQFKKLGANLLIRSRMRVGFSQALEW